MYRTAATLLALCLAWPTWPALAAPAEAPPPQRVVSLNLCTDQLAVLLLPPDRIAAVSFLARDPELSHVADRAATLPIVHGTAEEILPLRPDLVLAGTFTTRPTVRLLKAKGIPVLELGLASGFDDIRAQTRAVAAALGVPERGEALLAEMDRRLAAAAPAAGDARPRVLTFAPGGFTAGAGTLSDAIMRAAGVANYAAARGLNGYGYLPVEAVAADPPDLLVGGREAAGHPSLAGRLLSHPALARSIPPAARLRIPGSLSACGGPFTVEAVERLAAARRALPAAGPQMANAPAGGPGR